MSDTEIFEGNVQDPLVAVAHILHTVYNETTGTYVFTITINRDKNHTDMVLTDFTVYEPDGDQD